MYDFVIIGAGVTGCSLGLNLAKMGKKVAIVERQWHREPTIIGELLQPGGVEQLKQLGLEELLEGIDAQRVPGYRIYLNNEYLEVKYPKNLTGAGFHHHLFLNKLRGLVKDSGVACITGEVTSLKFDGNQVKGFNYTSSEGEEVSLSGGTTVICDGAFSRFRDTLHQNQKEITSYFIGVQLEDVELPLNNGGHLFTGENAPLLLYPNGGKAVRCLIDYSGGRAPRIGKKLREELVEKYVNQLPKSVQDEFERTVLNSHLDVMPNHRLHGAVDHKVRGALLIGDSLNMRHPLTGGGMTAAFSDVNAFLHLLKQNEDVEACVTEFYSKRKEYNASINVLADALYGVMNHPILQKNVFEYLSSGGKKAEEPVAILSALNRDVNLLEKHFMAVAKSGVWRNMMRQPNLKGLKTNKTMVKDAISILAPLMSAENINSRIAKLG